MTKRDSDAPTGDGIVSEDITQLIEYVELTDERPVMSGPGWEMARPADDLEDAPIFVDDESGKIPDLDAVDAGEDIDLFTETELDLNRRLSQVEDEQLELAAGIGAERARWQKRIANLQADMTGRNRLLAEREHEIEDLSARLASLAIERDVFVEELRALQRSVGQSDVLDDRRAPTPADGIIASLHERLSERSQALLVAREEIDRLRAEREQLMASIAERNDFIERLHVRLRELEGGDQGGGELRKLMHRFFGGEQKTEKPEAVLAVAAMPGVEATVAGAAAELTAELPQRQTLIEDMQQPPPRIETPVSARNEPRVRRYLIGLDMIGSVYEMMLPRINVGRTRDNDLRIVDPTVSRLHAVLHVRGREVTVIDANSRNGVFVNGIQLRYAKLEDGDTLTFGAVRFRYRVGSGPSGGDYGLD
jgi:hypothetical protein